MWFFPKIIAHRGGGKLAPENTLAAMRCGYARGFRGVEFDVMLSSDSVPVLMHDPEFGRTIRGAGKVCNTSARELAAMDAGSWFSPAFAGEPVPTYEQVAWFCKEKGLWMNVEIKPVPGYEEQTGRVVAKWTQRLFADELAALPLGGNDPSLPLFSSFSFDALAAAKDAAPLIPRGLLVDTIPSDWQERLRALEAIALHVNHRSLSPALAAAVKQAGYGLFCYTVNTEARAKEIMAWGVDAFCTDRLDVIAPGFA